MQTLFALGTHLAIVPTVDTTTMMHILSLSLVVLAAVSLIVVDAAKISNPIVKCSTIKGTATFQACATSRFYTPSGVVDQGKPMYLGGFRSDYNITLGLKEGTDTTKLSQAETDKAYSNGITVSVERDDNDKCKVTVGIKGKSTACKSCTYCGNDKYTADCTNLKNGRAPKCESAPAQVYYPLSVAATSSSSPPPPAPTKPTKPPPPTKPMVKPPMRAPIKAPVKPPAKVPVSVKAPAKMPVKAVLAPK
jgi:hypothetical protein